MKKTALTLVFSLLAFAHQAANASGLERMKEYFQNIQSAQASFHQTVTDKQGQKTQDVTGTMQLQKPNKFRWDYHKPYVQQIVGDGEKITKVVSVEIQGARKREDAEKIARAIGNSLLVKSSWFGEDPNWGRLADAAGYARTGLDEAKLDIHYNEVPAVIGGRPIPENKPKWKEVVKARQFKVRINLNLGSAHFRLLASDLTDGYVNYNKSE